MARRSRPRGRKRIGRVSYFPHHGSWYVYYRQGQRPVRRRVADTEAAAEGVAAQINAQLSRGGPTLFDFAPITVGELRSRFLAHHEEVRRSSLATIRRYRAASQHLENFVAERGGPKAAHEVDAEHFAGWLRAQSVSPNGHANTARRRLRDKGLRYILEVCRSMFAYAQKRRHLPPYAENPFALIDIDRLKIADAKPVFVFDAASELRFFESADPWTLGVHFTLAKTGMRPGELTHLLMEDFEFASGWMRIRNKPELEWRIKTGAERSVPLLPELVDVLRAVIGTRTAGLVFVRPQFDVDRSPLGHQDEAALIRAMQLRTRSLEGDLQKPLSREQRSKVARSVWRDAGAVRSDWVRTTFLRTAAQAGIRNATCSKSWRHTFATLLQDANVDPLIRQITLGHAPAGDARGGLGMTGVYTHTRPETQKREIERALRLWPESLAFASRAITSTFASRP